VRCAAELGCRVFVCVCDVCVCGCAYGWTLGGSERTTGWEEDEDEDEDFEGDDDDDEDEDDEGGMKR